MSQQQSRKWTAKSVTAGGFVFSVVLPILILVGIGVVYSSRSNAQNTNPTIVEKEDVKIIRDMRSSALKNMMQRVVTSNNERRHPSEFGRRRGVTTIVANRRTRVSAPIAKMIREIQQINEDDQEAVEDKMRELRDALSDEFDKMHDRQAEEIQQSRERLEALAERHERRAENKDAIVERRINDLLDRPDELDWNIERGAETIRDIQSELGNVERKRFGAPSPPSPPKVQALPRIQGRTFEFRGGKRRDFDLSDLNLDSLFGLAGELASIAGELSEATAKSETYEKLRKNQTISELDANVAAQRKEAIAKRLKVYQKQIEAVEERLGNELEFAQEMLENVSRTAKILETKFNNGTGTEEGLLEAQRQMMEAQKRVRETEQILERFGEMIEDIFDNDRKISIEFEFDESEEEEGGDNEQEEEHSESSDEEESNDEV